MNMSTLVAAVNAVAFTEGTSIWLGSSSLARRWKRSPGRVWWWRGNDGRRGACSGP